MYENPQAFDIRRKDTPHLALGAGPHLCLGRPLARMEIGTLIPRVLEAFPDMHVTVDDPAWLPGTSVTGFSELPVKYTPRRVRTHALA